MDINPEQYPALAKEAKKDPNSYILPESGVVSDEVAAFLEEIREVSRKHGMYLDPAYWAKTGQHQLDVRQPLTGRLHARDLSLDVLYPGKEYEDGVELVSE